MTKIAVFDSGLGSLSIIRAIQKACKCQIVYFADKKNFPYGKKSKEQLNKIIKNSINLLEEKFSPDIIVVGSNTPTLVLDIQNDRIIGVNPPLDDAANISKTKNIGILATSSTVKSRGLQNYIKESKLDKLSFHKIDSSDLVSLAESGKFLTDMPYCEKVVKQTLQKKINEKNIDVCTLSSTHLPFLKTVLESVFPSVKFIDPADKVAKKIARKAKDQTKRNSLKIYASGDIARFKKTLEMLGVKNQVNFLSF